MSIAKTIRMRFLNKSVMKEREEMFEKFYVRFWLDPKRTKKIKADFSFLENYTTSFLPKSKPTSTPLSVTGFLLKRKAVVYFLPK